MHERKTIKPDRLQAIQPKNAPQRRAFTRCDIIAEKLQGGTVLPGDVKRALRVVKDASELPEERMKVIDALRVPCRDVFPDEWANAILRNIAKKDNDQTLREAARSTLFYRSKKF